MKETILPIKRYDATGKDLFETQPESWMTYCRLSCAGPVGVINANLDTITAEADKVLWVAEAQPWIVHVELQASRDRRLVSRILRYNVLLNYRHEVPVRSVLILLRRESDAADLTGQLEQGLPSGEGYLTFRYHVVRAWEQPVDQIVQGSLGTLPMAVLSDVSTENLPSVLRRIAERLHQEAPPDESSRLWAATTLLMGLRYTPDLVEQILKGVGDMNFLGIRGIEESSTYQQILSQGVAKGLEEGKAKGLEEGKAKGLEEGQLKEAKSILSRLLQKRFGHLPSEVGTTIDSIEDVAQVEHLTERLFDVSNWEELFASGSRDSES